MIAEQTRKAIDRVALVRLLVKSPPAQHAIQTARGARVVREPLRFTVRQFGPRRPAGYRLRGCDLRIFLRHRTRDVHILNEIFGGTGGRQSYAPPSAVASALGESPSPTVLDLGANIGLFGAYVLSRWPHAAIHSLEPDPRNLEVLSRTIAANGLEGRWSLERVAAANRAGKMAFASGLCADSHLVSAKNRAVGGRTITVEAVDIFTANHDVDIMKMDIEGGEWAILTDERLGGLKSDVLVLEWHARGCPELDPRATTVRALRAAGYDRVEETEWGIDNGLVWAWRERAPTLIAPRAGSS